MRLFTVKRGTGDEVLARSSLVCESRTSNMNCCVRPPLKPSEQRMLMEVIEMLVMVQL